LVVYTSRGLGLTLSHPADAQLEQDGPLLIITSAQSEDARVVIVRGTPDFFARNQIVPTAESPPPPSKP
jgi:hypothetical protein